MIKKIGLVLTLLLTFVSTTFSADKILRIGYPGTNALLPGVAGLAQDKKFIDEELKKIGYKAEYKPFAAAGPAVNEALATKAIDVAIYADFPGLVSKSKGVPHTLVGIYDNFVNAALIVSKDSPIKSIKELKGKKIGFIKGTYLHKVLFQLLELNGLKPTDVQLINTVDGEASLIGKTIDAYVTTDTSEALAIVSKKFAKTIDSTNKHPQFAGQGVIVARDEYLQDNSNAIVALDKALIRAKALWVKTPEVGYKSLVKSGQDLASIKYIYAKDKGKFNYVTLRVNDASIKKLQDTVSWLLDNELIKKGFDVKAWTNNSYYDKAAKAK